VEPLRIALCGAAGRMGAAIVAAVEGEPGLRLVRAIERPGHPLLGRPAGGVELTERLDLRAGECDAILDFSAAAATPGIARAALAAATPLVSGVTGLGDREMQALAEAARRIAVVHAANMSFGVALLERALAAAAERLPDGYDIEIVEMHHRRKQDAPSGTAMRLAALLERMRPASTRLYGRGPAAGARKPGEIAIHSLRGGDVFGEHRVVFAGPGERLEWVHRAESRAAFAAGAVAAARFVRGRGPGLYGMAEVFGIKAGQTGGA